MFCYTFCMRIFISDLDKNIGQEVSINGWVSVRRDQGKMVFVDIRDMSGTVQCVVLPSHNEALDAVKEVRAEWVLEIKGIVNKRPEKNIKEGVINGDIELEITEIKVLSRSQDLPFEIGTEVNLDTYLDYLPLTLRSERARDIFKIQETIIKSFRQALGDEKFTEFQAPAIVGGDAEGGAAAFKVDYYYDKTAYLATSPQFYKQILVGVYERVFTTPKVFRGEKHSTSRHLSEYSSMDFEMGFINDHTDVMAVLEKAVRNIVLKIKENHLDILSRFKVESPLVPEKIPVLKLREAQEILEKEFGAKCLGEPDLEPEHERQLCEWSKKENNSDFIFITHYPVSKRPFYSYEDEKDLGFTKSFDLLFRGLEITTGGQRVHKYDELLERMRNKGLDPEKFTFYLQAFKYGMPPHGGSATGLERLTARMLEIDNVKEATLFPRDLNRIDNRLSQ